MHKKISIQWKITIISACLIALTCVVLTMAVNVSAFRMADSIDAQKKVTRLQHQEPNVVETTKMLPAISTVDMWKIKASFGKKSILYMILAILFGSALTYYITGKALKPLKKLANDMQNITPDTISKAIEVNDNSIEIMELAESFNNMLNRLNDAYALQKRFAADAAHELRTPLAVLQAKIDVFQKEECHTKKEYDVLIYDLKKQILRLKKLSQSLLEMTVIEDQSEWTEFEINEMMEDIVSELSPIAQKKQVQIRLRCEACIVNGNIDQLYRAFYNLIENGIKYNIQSGIVTITVQKTQNHKTKIVISDTGIGIPDDMKPYIFEPFYRVDKSRSRQMGGAGLGLAMVESIVKKHNGSIEVSNGAVTGIGTSFTIEW